MGPAATTPFIGRVANGRFKFYRVITGRNGFLPIISGKIVATRAGAQLRLILRLHIGAVAFELVFIGICVRALFENGFAWGPLGMIALLLAMTIFFFFQEARRAIAILRREFDN